MATETRLHLWIPEQEIDYVDKTPAGRKMLFQNESAM